MKKITPNFTVDDSEWPEHAQQHSQTQSPSGKWIFCLTDNWLYE